jgi:hypothetical protein
MSKLIRDAMDACVYYSDKLRESGNLAEYELLMYEQMCRMIETFCRVQDVHGRIQLARLEQEELERLAAQDGPPSEPEEGKSDEGHV